MPASASARLISAERLWSTATLSVPGSAVAGLSGLGHRRRPPGSQRRDAQPRPPRPEHGRAPAHRRQELRELPSRTRRPRSMMPTTSASCWTSGRRWLDTKHGLALPGEDSAAARAWPRCPPGRGRCRARRAAAGRGRTAARRDASAVHAQRIGRDLVARPVPQARPLQHLARCASATLARRCAAEARAGSRGPTGMGRRRGLDRARRRRNSRRRSRPEYGCPEHLDAVPASGRTSPVSSRRSWSCPAPLGPRKP